MPVSFLLLLFQHSRFEFSFLISFILYTRAMKLLLVDEYNFILLKKQNLKMTGETPLSLSKKFRG